MLPDSVKPQQSCSSVWGDHHAVIHIPRIITRLEGAFTKVVEAIEIDVCKCLTEQIANWHAGGCVSICKLHHHKECVLAFDLPAEQLMQHVSVDAVEKLAHIHMQHPSASVCATHGGLQPIAGGMGTSPNPACKTLGDVAALKRRRDC